MGGVLCRVAVLRDKLEPQCNSTTRTWPVSFAGGTCAHDHMAALCALQLGTPCAVQAGRGLRWSPGAGPV